MKKLMMFISVLLLSVFLLSCGSSRTDFQKFVEAIYDSETIISGYDEVDTIKDDGLVVYKKEMNFLIQRGKNVRTEVDITETKLSTSGSSLYDETKSSYFTVDNTKFVKLNGSVYENDYTMPTYYLTFVMSEEFLEDGYTLEVNENSYKLSAKVLDNKISSLFLNKSLGNVKDLYIEVTIENGRLELFNAKYVTTNGFNSEISIDYFYGVTGSATAVFYLEGGLCQNSKDRVSYIYNFDGTKDKTYIVDPNELEKNPLDQIVKHGYHIEGWYQTKTVNDDGSVEYSNKWDFDKDKMGLDGVTLYAKWEINRIYTYELYYYDNEGKEVFLDSYEVEEGDKFKDTFLDVKDVEGFTSLGYLDEDGNEWNTKFTHPGGDSDLAIKVYLKLIEGEYTTVKNRRQFTSAISKNANIYLLNDIDLDGYELCFKTYSGIILGNGHKLSNFEVEYDTSKSGLKESIDGDSTLKDHLYISLFYELKDAVIKDLTFENMLIDVNTQYSQIKKIVVAPLAILASNTKLENVVMTGDIILTKTPECEIEVIYEDFWYRANEAVADSSSSITITK